MLNITTFKLLYNNVSDIKKQFSILYKIFSIILGTLLLTASSYIEVPMIPVPMTMQTFAVPLIGALYGWRLAGITIITWLMQAALGMPVLAGGAFGIHYFLGPTAGYLFSFPFAGMLMGWFAESGWNGDRVWLAFVGMLLSNAICLLFGSAWLAMMIGFQQAVNHGLLPFLLGAVVKSALAASTLKLIAIAKAIKPS